MRPSSVAKSGVFLLVQWARVAGGTRGPAFPAARCTARIRPPQIGAARRPYRHCSAGKRRGHGPTGRNQPCCQGLTVHDSLSRGFPDVPVTNRSNRASPRAARSVDRVSSGGIVFVFDLLIAQTARRYWLQFSRPPPRFVFRAMVKCLDWNSLSPNPKCPGLHRLDMTSPPVSSFGETLLPP